MGAATCAACADEDLAAFQLPTPPSDLAASPSHHASHHHQRPEHSHRRQQHSEHQQERSLQQQYRSLRQQAPQSSPPSWAHAPPPASAYRAHRPNLESSLDAWERLLASWRIPYFDPSARGAPAPAVVRERVRQCLAPMFAQRPPPAPHNELIDNFGRAKDVLLRLGFGPYLRPPPGGSGESTAR